MEIQQTNTGAVNALGELIDPLGLKLEDAGGNVNIYGADPIFPSAVKLAEAVSISAMAAAVGVAAIEKERSGTGQDLSIDVRKGGHHNSPEFTCHPMIGGHKYPKPLFPPYEFSVIPFRTKDGRFVYPIGVYPHQHIKYGNFFNCGANPASIAAAIATWDALELEEEAAAVGLPIVMARTPEEWAAHPQGQYLAAEPVIAVRKIGESEPIPFSPRGRIFDQIKVLSLTHAIAGPVVGRTLAEHGANVLCVNDDDFEHEWVYDDANVGQRSTRLDLNVAEDLELCTELAKTADVFIDSFRGRKIQQFGFLPEQLAELRPGIVVVSVRCYGWGGPWFERGGFDQIGSAVSGLTMVEGIDGAPALPATIMLNDYTTGYLGAAGAIAALRRRAKEGGSYHVTVSLTRSAMWAMSLGLVPKVARSFAVNPAQLILKGMSLENRKNIEKSIYGLKQRLATPEMIVRDTPLGKLCRLAPAVTFSETPAYWSDPLLVPRGSSTPAW